MNQEFKASLKSADTEEHIDIYFYRPIGYQWARFFRMLHVTPNVVTILSIFLGVGAGICFYFDDLAINILGIFLLIWANVYDSCDGQLARLTGTPVPGRWAGAAPAAQPAPEAGPCAPDKAMPPDGLRRIS